MRLKANEISFACSKQLDYREKIMLVRGSGLDLMMAGSGRFGGAMGVLVSSLSTGCRQNSENWNYFIEKAENDSTRDACQEHLCFAG